MGNSEFSTFLGQLDQALLARKSLLETLQSEKTDAYRLFHGVAEGRPGLTIDRYGPMTLVQTFRDPLSEEEWPALTDHLQKKLGPTSFAYNHRANRSAQSFEEWHRRLPLNDDISGEIICREFGVNYAIRARHPGIDPWLFLDLRAGRRLIRKIAKDQTVLNLFSYTCSMGVVAAASGARDVWNVDFASSHLEVGRKNAALNQIGEDRFRTIEEDCFPVMRQLAGLPVGGRFNQKLKYKKFEPQQFDLVFLDPPAWSKGAFGAVDVEGDYASLFKSAVLSAKAGGGRVIATNHVPTVPLDQWTDSLKRCADKAGRPIKSLQTLTPEADFPSFDGNHPLKIAVCEL